jgi:hypothetical protein
MLPDPHLIHENAPERLDFYGRNPIHKLALHDAAQEV